MKFYWVVFIILLSPHVLSERIKLCSLDRAALSQKDGAGYYWDVLRAVYESAGMKLQYYSAPFKRCLALVENKTVDGAVAVFKTEERSKIFIYPKSRLHFSSYGLIYLKHSNFDTIENITGNVGIIRGYDFSSWLPSQLRFFYLKNNSQAIKMLKMERINYHADDLQDTLITLHRMGERSEDYVFKSFSNKSLFVVFTRNIRGQELADKFDTGLNNIYKNGIMAQIIEQHGLAYSILNDFK